MKAVWLIAGIVLLLLGLGWMVYILGGVFSQAEGFTRLNDMWGVLGFHAITMALGTFCVGRATPARTPRVETAQ